MDKITDTKLFPAAVLGFFASWFGHAWQLMVFTFIVIVMDGITGTLAGRLHEGLNSKKAYLGLYKKFGIMCLFCLGFFLDNVLNHFIIEGFSFDVPFALPIGLIISAWIIITETISICENIERLGVPIPKWLLRLLTKTQDKINRKEG